MIENEVLAVSDTGENTIEGNSASINTGNANAVTNLINILNSNVSDTNWLLGMINIFGNWQGDLAFGRPDLWVGASVRTDRPRPDESGSVKENKGNGN